MDSIFVTFSTATGDRANKPQCNEMHHPLSALTGGGGDNADLESTIEYFMTLGGRKLTTFPVGPEAAAEMIYRLKCAAGNHDMSISPLSITYEEYLNVDQHSEQRSFIIGQALEKVSHTGFTGEDFGGGRALLLDFKGVGAPGAAAEDRVARCHVLLIHQTAMSITESGVLVSM